MTMFQFQGPGSGEAQSSFQFGAVEMTAPMLAATGYVLRSPNAGVGVTRAVALPAPVLTQVATARGGSLVSMTVKHEAAGGAATNIVYTLYANGVATSQTCTVAGNSVVAVTSVGAPVVVPAGTRLEVIGVAAAELADPPAGIICGINFN